MSRKNPNASDLDREYMVTRIALTVFKLIGLAPFTVQRFADSNLRKKFTRQNAPTLQFSTSRFGYAYNFCLITMLVCIIIWIMISQHSNASNGNSVTAIDYLHDVIEVATSAIACSTTIMIWLILGFRQKVMVRFLNRLLSFDNTTVNCNGNHPPQSIRPFALIVCAMITCAEGGLIFVNCLGTGSDLAAFLTRIGPVIVSTWFVSQYTIALKMIERRYEALNRSILDCCVQPIANSSHEILIGIDTTERNIATLRETHWRLGEIASDISSFYSLPILFSVSLSCSELIISAFALAGIFIKMPDEAAIISTVMVKLFCVIQHTSSLVPLSAGVSNIDGESGKTSDILKKLLGNPINNRDVAVEIERFVIQSLHKKIRFTACGLFSLDLTLIQSIITTVITYLVILVQFDLGM